MLVSRAGIHKMVVRIANWEDPDQTASSEAVCSGSALFVQVFWQATSVRNFRAFTIVSVRAVSRIHRIRTETVTATQLHRFVFGRPFTYEPNQ